METLKAVKRYIKSNGLDTKGRKELNVLSRYYLYAYLRSELSMTYQSIGDLFNKSHDSVLKGIREHKKLIEGPNKVHYLATVSSAAVNFPLESALFITTPKSGTKMIEVSGEALKKLKIIKDSMKSTSVTYSGAVEYLIKNTIIIEKT